MSVLLVLLVVDVVDRNHLFVFALCIMGVCEHAQVCLFGLGYVEHSGFGTIASSTSLRLQIQQIALGRLNLSCRRIHYSEFVINHINISVFS